MNLIFCPELVANYDDSVFVVRFKLACVRHTGHGSVEWWVTWVMGHKIWLIVSSGVASVCLSPTFVYCVETSKHILKLIYHLIATPHRSSFSVPIIIFRQNPQWGRRMQVGYEKIAIFD